MKLKTEVIIPVPQTFIRHADRLLLIGSCFAESMAEHFVAGKFRCDVNPFGTLYNPMSIRQALLRIADNRLLVENEVRPFDGVGWCSWEHHGRFASPSKEEALEKMNERVAFSSHWFREADVLVVTFGSAWVYRLRSTGAVVGNCHKQDERLFVRSLLSVDEIVREWENLLLHLHELNPRLRVLFTVSPIRYLRDGAHENQLSKATLLLSIQRLMKETNGVLSTDYFPAYEILQDELRDYRFYADDMVHPSSLAELYIWERFSQTFFDNRTREILSEWKEVNKALDHRPFRPHSEEYKQFIRQTLLKIETIRKKMPYFDVEKEIAQCHTLLNE